MTNKVFKLKEARVLFVCSAARRTILPPSFAVKFIRKTNQEAIRALAEEQRFEVGKPRDLVRL